MILEGGEIVEGQIDDIGDALTEMARIDVRYAIRALENLDRTDLNRLQTEIKNTVKDVKDFKVTDAKHGLDNLDKTKLSRLQSEIKNTTKDFRDLKAEGIKTKNSLDSAFKGGGLIGGALPEAISEIKQLTTEGIKLDASFDKLTRFTSTLDKNFQTPLALKKFQDDIENLSTQIPQNADDIAKASFTIKSAFQDITEPELIDFLKQFGIAATASNTDIESHTENVAALAKQYGITAKELPKFNALIASSFGQALAKDSAVAQGFNDILNVAKSTKQPLESLIASMSTLQGASNNAAANTTLLKGALEKLSDPEYIKGFKQIGIDVFDANKNFKDLGTIINEVAKEIEGLNDQEIAKKFDFLRDQEARQGFLTLARNAKAFNQQMAEGGNLDTYSNKTNVMLNSTEARWKKFWSTIQNGQKQFGNTISNDLLSIFDQQTVGSQIEVFFVNTASLIAKGIVGLTNGLASGFQGAALSIAQWIGLSPADAEKQKKELQDTFNGMYQWIDAEKQQFAKNVRKEDEQYFKDIMGSPTATKEMKESALRSWQALQENFKTGSTQTVEIVKQSGVQLKTSLDGLSKNAAISPELRNKLKEEAKKIGENVKQGVTESLPKISAASKDLQAALTKLLNDQRISSNLKEAIKKELSGLDKTILESKPVINNAISNLLVPDITKAKESANLLGLSFTNNVTTTILEAKPKVENAVRTLTGTQQAASQAKTNGYKIGIDLVQGFLNGMDSKRDEIRTMSMLLGNTASGGLKTQLQEQSPSKLTILIGEFFGEGFAIGIEKKINRAKSSAKKLADETIKTFKEAVKEFNKLAGATPETVQGIQATSRVTDAVSAQQEIIKLRGELGINQAIPIPKDFTSTMGEMEFLKQKKQEVDDFNKSLQDLEKGYQDVQDAIEASDKSLEDRIKSIENSGAIELINLQEQINLTGVVNESDRERIKNYFDIERLRQEMMNDGFGAAQIEEAEKILEAQQSSRRELNHILEIRKQIAEATNFGESLSKQLTELQNNNRELTEYEKTLNKINTDLKDISPSQKAFLLNTAKQIDAQKQFNEQYNQTYDLIRESLDILTESGTSFGEKMKAIFGGIADRFKQMLLDMVSQWLTSKILNIGGGASSGGNWLQTILGGIFGGGGGAASGVSVAGTVSGSSASTAEIQRIFSSFGGFGNGNRSNASHGTAAGPGSGGFGALGGFTLGGMAANLIGGLIGGRAGGILSSIGSGAATGAAIGSIIPGFGTVIGGLIGGAAGFIASLFGGDPKRKADKNENMPRLQQGFAESIKGFQDLIAEVTALNINPPESALAKGKEIRDSVANSFGLTWESKKYRKIAQQQIAQQLAMIDRVPDGLMEQLKTAVDRAKTAGERERRILPEFASGVYMSSGFASQYGDFKRRNGMLQGSWTGRDTIPAMVAHGEMILNPYQQQAIRRAAGFDVFKFGNVPGYADGAFVAPSFNSPTVSSANIQTGNQNILLQPQFTLVLEGVSFEDNTTAYLESEKGERTVVKVVKKAQKSKELS